ncbi:MAG: hypothetical protein C3F02_00230 [Parcubacteria group bacterium]|nr:MAG: hypothetical protein C3F02_00230 [Parcubacteria group bacterium]
MEKKNYKFILFSVAGEQWAMPLYDNSQFFTCGDLVALPQSDLSIAGLTYHSGQIITLLNSRNLLSLGLAGAPTKRHGLLFSFNGDYYGLLVDEPGETIKAEHIFTDRSRKIFAKYLKINKQKVYIIEVSDIFEKIHLYD